MTIDAPVSRAEQGAPASAPAAPSATTHAAADRAEQQRRLAPRLWDTDWLVLKGMHVAIRDMAKRLVKPGAIVLDFGCGVKPYETLFTAHGATYQGADFDPGHAHPGHTYEIAPSGKLSAPDACADTVVSFQVLEHVRDLDTYFAEAARVLRPDGHLLLSTHGTWLYHPHPEDHRRWTREGLIGDIEARGFEVIDCVPVVGPLAWTTTLRLTCFKFALMKLPLVCGPLAAVLGTIMNLKAAIEDKVTPAWVTRDNACVYVTLSRPKSRAALPAQRMSHAAENTPT
ncbi:MAG: class I SAM-dependent methyltransferase [Hyphomicrobiaceae bacterium]|nr:class I SAM-dependent methyltransferase [Hyphomicrobiaceae bacterium]